MSQYADKTTQDSASLPARKDRLREKDAALHSPGMGNHATGNLMHDMAIGKQLPADLRARLETSFGISLQSVRVRDDAAARNAAEALDAEAFVEGEQIHWGSGAPPLNSREAVPLLAHEVSHVALERRAVAIERRVSSAHEASENEADAMAGRALAGEPVGSAGTGAVPAIARQARGLKDYAERALAAFLRKVAGTQPPQDLRRAKVVRNALDMLALSAGPVANTIDVAQFMASAPNDPAQMARAFVSRMTRLVKGAFDSLDKMPFVDPPASTISRLKEAWEKSQAGGQEIPQEPGYRSPEQRAQDIQEKFWGMRGAEGPKTYGPVPLDPFQLGRFFKGAGQPQQPRAAPPVAQSYPQVEAAIARIPKNALVPAQAKGKGHDDDWADAQEFARHLAGELDVAQKLKRETITINLGDNYAGVKDQDRVTLRRSVEAIIAQIRTALPHHASEVTNADIMTGKRLLTRGRAAAE